MMRQARGMALVTGGTRGIGLGIAHALAGEGWDVGVCGMRAGSDVGAALESLRGHGTRIEYFSADLSDSASRVRLVDEVRDRCGVVAALVNNAGRAPRVRADILDATEDSFDEVLGTNLRGPYFLTQAIARDQVARRRETRPSAPPSRSSPPCRRRWRRWDAASTVSARRGWRWRSSCLPPGLRTRESRSTK